MSRKGFKAELGSLFLVSSAGLGIKNQFWLNADNKLESKSVSCASERISSSYQTCDAEMKKSQISIAGAVQPAERLQRAH